MAWGQVSKLVVLATSDWEPYIGEKLPGHGYVHEIAVEAFKSMGYRTEIHFYPWARALAMAEGGKADGLFPEYFEEHRQASFAYSNPFQGGPVGFLVRKDSRIAFDKDPRKNLTEALRGLASHRFGVVRGYVNTQAFDEATFLTKEEAGSDAQNIQKLWAQRIDLIFIDQFVARHLIRTRFPDMSDRLVFLEPPLEIKPLYIAFSKRAPGYEQKLKDFNAGLERIEKAGTLKAILKKYGF